MLIGSLFSGIGGLELGLERAGLGSVAWQCEIDPFCRQVLSRHWPDAQRFEDVSNDNDWTSVDILCGGFPCQDVSSAGKRAGLDGARSGLWREYLRVAKQIKPAVIIVENVRSGAKLWLPTVRRDLHLSGYDSVALGVSARDVGAPHSRARVFVVAYPHGFLGTTGGGFERLREPSAFGSSGIKRIEAHWQQTSPPYGRVVDGLSRGLDKRRIKALGNSVVPQCAQLVGYWIKENLL